MSSEDQFNQKPPSHRPHLDLQIRTSSSTLDISSDENFSVELIFTLRNTASPITIEKYSSPLFSCFLDCLGPHGLRYVPISESSANRELQEDDDMTNTPPQTIHHGSPPKLSVDQLQLGTQPITLYPGVPHRIIYPLGTMNSTHPRLEKADGKKKVIYGPNQFVWHGISPLEERTYEIGLNYWSTTVEMMRWGWVSCAAMKLPKIFQSEYWEWHGERIPICLVETARVTVKAATRSRNEG